MTGTARAGTARTAIRVVGAGAAAVAAAVAFSLLGARGAAAEEPATPGAESLGGISYNGQPLETMRPMIEAPVDLAAAATPPPAVRAAIPSSAADAPVATSAPAGEPLRAAAADTDQFRGGLYNGQPLETMIAALTTPAPAAAPAAPAGPDGRHVIYSVREQRVWLVEADGNVSKTYLVSGRAGTPRPGSYSVFSKSSHARSGSVTMRHMIRFARGRSLAIGFHSIPVTRSGRPIQSLGELGSYRSHGCVRQAPSDAAHLWDWAPVGTRVVVRA